MRSEDVVELIGRVFKNSYREMVVVIGLDNQNRPTVVHTVALGSPDQAPVSISSYSNHCCSQTRQASSSCIIILVGEWRLHKRIRM